MYNVDFNYKNLMLTVENGYEIRDMLKRMRFSYDNTTKTWRKSLSTLSPRPAMEKSQVKSLAKSLLEKQIIAKEQHEMILDACVRDVDKWSASDRFFSITLRKIRTEQKKVLMFVLYQQFLHEYPVYAELDNNPADNKKSREEISSVLSAMKMYGFDDENIEVVNTIFENISISEQEIKSRFNEIKLADLVDLNKTLYKEVQHGSCKRENRNVETDA